MRSACLIAIFTALVAAAPADPADIEPDPALAAEHDLTEAGLYAVLETSMGTAVAELFEEGAPITVANFVDLATGAKPWRRASRAELLESLHASGLPRDQWRAEMDRLIEALPVNEGTPLFDGTVFHRVIPGFMIQGGSPTGEGTGGPGFEIDDEFNPELLHTEAGRLSMANSGPNSGGSQFFVTVVPTPHLDFSHPRNLPRRGGHAVFGQVIRGLGNIVAISEAPRDGGDCPLEEITLEQVIIVRVAEASTAAPVSPE